MPIEVIVASLPRTGTTSVKTALELLGYNKTMHMYSCVEDPLLMAAWREIYANHLEKTWTSEDWRNFFDVRFPGYVAGINEPFADFAVEIARAYPEAKVILLHRDPKAWLVSFQHLLTVATYSWWDVFCVWPLAGVYQLHRLQKPRLAWWKDVYNYPDAGQEVMPFYITKIKAAVAPERLLIYKVQDGWGPLCKFLGKNIPNADFPRLNDGETLARNENKWKTQGLNIWMKYFKQTVVAVLGLAIIISIYQRGLVFSWMS